MASGDIGIRRSSATSTAAARTATARSSSAAGSASRTRSSDVSGIAWRNPHVDVLRGLREHHHHDHSRALQLQILDRWNDARFTHLLIEILQEQFFCAAVAQGNVEEGGFFD